ncbi:MAG: response regulator [Lachnospiraceae bacterium]|jgi:DNA-binding response OmpR family regulator|nr:response regulator [Lachnospiraceae bacterium]MCR5702485.1 response regulator [Lachnospiraceae bacterium]
MAYRVLLTGKNVPIIDTFFNFLWESYELITSSTRFEDLKRHIELTSPDIVIYCLYNETQDEMMTVNEVRKRLGHTSTFVIVGAAEDCDEFQEKSEVPADLVLKKPLTTEMIKKQIDNYMEDAKRAEERAERMRLAEEEANRKKHILVIDDDPMMLKLIKEHLHHKYDVAIAKGGMMAYKFLEKKDTDLILLDYEMPLENGPVVFKNIRSMEGKEGVPIVFLTGINDRERIMEVAKLQPQGYLLKPIDRASLLDKINQLIG